MTTQLSLPAGAVAALIVVGALIAEPTIEG
jgi:hypothetical protein